MTVAHVQSTTNSTFSSVSSLASPFGAAVGSGNSVVGSFVAGGGSITSFSVTDDKSNTYSVGGVSGFGRTGQFWLANITNGPTTITVTITGGGAQANWIVLLDEFSGTGSTTDGQTQQQQAAPGTGANAMTSGSITTTVAGDLVVGSGFNVQNQTDALTAGTSPAYTATAASLAGKGFVGLQEWLVQGAAGSIAATFTMAGAADSSGTHVVAIKATGGGGGPTDDGAAGRTGATQAVVLL